MASSSQRRTSIGNICQDATIGIRDFGFPASDPRHYGHPDTESFKAHLHLFPKYLEAQQRRLNRNKNTRPPEIIWDENTEKHLCVLDVDDESQEEGDDDDDDEDNEGDLTLLKTFPFILHHLELAFAAAAENQNHKQKVTVKRAKGLYDFSKGADCEMELVENDNVLIVESKDQQLHQVPSTLPSKDPKNLDRFASIEELDQPKTPNATTAAGSVAVKTASYLTLNPEAPELFEHLQEFLRMQGEYGSGWVVAVKLSLRDVGGTSLPEGHEALQQVDKVPRVVYRFMLRLLDIGLVPQSYVG
ncbi:hypothetical protein BDR26DRAFT_920444 [Obelidium mucronatum]|nr:hypothetical protein BDR26DRAFT_920444 [Obelidium mucronatum]